MDDINTPIFVDFEFQEGSLQESCKILETGLVSVEMLAWGGFFVGNFYLKFGPVDFSLLDGIHDNEPFPLAWLLGSLSYVANELHENALPSYTLYSLGGQFCFEFRQLDRDRAEISELVNEPRRVATFAIYEFLSAVNSACAKFLDSVLGSERHLRPENLQVLQLYFSNKFDELNSLERRLGLR